MTDQGFTADQIDTSRAHPARMYDYFLGGRDNYEVDRQAAERIIVAIPDVIPTARGNRAFLERAVRFVVDNGIRQIVDIGTGIPTSPNTHEIAQSISADVRVAYVDNDPIVAAHADARLTNADNTGFFLADVRKPQSILDHPTLRDMIDFDQPVALFLVAVLHFITDEEDPAGIVATLTEALPEGSYLVLTHISADFHGGSFPPEVNAVYAKATATLTQRTRSRIEPFFNGFDLVDPGLVQVPLWRPEGPVPNAGELAKVAFYGGVGRK
jgi:hypothetical protein